MVLSLVAFSSMAAAIASVSGFVQPQQHSPARGTTVPLFLSSHTTLPSPKPSISSCLALSSSPFDDSSGSSSSSNSNSNNNNNLDQSLPPPHPTDDNSNNLNHYHGIELPSSDEMENNISEIRQLRWEREAYILSKFASGDELQELRKEGSRLRKELAEWRAVSTIPNSAFLQNMENKLYHINERDAEFMYCISKELMIQAHNDGDTILEEQYRVQMKEAALCIPQLNMHGLWVGKYGDHGYEMINITYSDETTLIATKVTGDRNVPKGEVTFTVDLSPQIVSSYASSTTSSSSPSQQSPPYRSPQQQQYHHVTNTLEPIVLDDKAQSQWGKKYLPRYVGKGRVASENFTNAQWMEGQFILVGRFFSFAWVPIGHQIFFGRPSSELILTMLKESTKEEMSKRDEVSVMRSVVKDMWEETYWTERETVVQDALYNEEGCFE